MGKDLGLLRRNLQEGRSNCVMFVSSDYATRMWTDARTAECHRPTACEKGNEYILPIRVGATIDIDGLPPTLGYLSLKDTTIDHIGDILIRKLQGAA